MALYDAKNKQICKLCNIEVASNKNGAFTSHLKKEHKLELNDYLLKHFYSKEDLKCKYENCNNLVKLYRGKPKESCGKSHKDKAVLICSVCNKEYFNKRNKTCSEECRSILMSNKTKKWHKNMSEKEKKEHFRKIIEKTANTRRKNKTPSWNSGKTGIYSEETIDKIRKAALENFNNGKFEKTKPEIIMEELLVKLGLNYKYSFIMGNRQYDFLLKDYNIVIECDGDYWHANPKFFPSPKKWQLERIKIDKLKNKIAEDNGYKILRFWEDDINNNLHEVEKKIKSYL